ncbi:Uncharacterised protein [Mycobacteroides abscessus]|nr:Uncharacterised protein [Mycobacteroides abscessus]
MLWFSTACTSLALPPDARWRAWRVLFHPPRFHQ